MAGNGVDAVELLGHFAKVGVEGSNSFARSSFFAAAKFSA
jgi:hypothetical protein